jgi:hypothetical protein
VATSFPNSVQNFPQMQDVNSSDGALIAQYQAAMQAGNLTLAKQILTQIPNNQNKIITADYLNTVNDTVVALETYIKDNYTPGYVVSETQPEYQAKDDFWFEVTG